MMGRSNRKNEFAPSLPKQSRITSPYQHRRKHSEDEGGGIRQRIEEFIASHRSVIFLFLCGVVSGVFLRGCFQETEKEAEAVEEQEEVRDHSLAEPDLFKPVREAPERFKRDSYFPAKRESEASGAIIDSDFSAGRDLVYVDDARVWWESDNDGDTDDECDHSMHVVIEIPFRRLVNLVEATGWQLRVQEAYRATGTHSRKSLHKQGRALDLTVDNFGEVKLTPFEKIAAYEKLAKLAWQAGFDWVYYENSAGGGPHIHASVKPDGPRMSDFKGKNK